MSFHRFIHPRFVRPFSERDTIREDGYRVRAFIHVGAVWTRGGGGVDGASVRARVVE
jgi:hypothetical protein